VRTDPWPDYMGALDTEATRAYATEDEAAAAAGRLTPRAKNRRSGEISLGAPGILVCPGVQTHAILSPGRDANHCATTMSECPSFFPLFWKLGHPYVV